MTIVVSVAVGNTVGTPTWAEQGVDTHKLWLEAGIVIMGATLAVDQIVASGLHLVAVILGTVAFSLLFVETL